MTAEAVLSLARDKGVMIATAESCTGGLIIGTLTEIPGSSDVVDRGFVTYSNDSKVEMLGVSEKTLTTDGAVSEQAASEMAEGALSRSNAALAISVTGIAGPGGSEFKPEGMVCFGIAQQSQKTHTETVQFGALGRCEVRRKTVEHAVSLLLDALTNGS